MSKRMVTEEQLIELMTQMGERWRQRTFPPMTPEQKARALESVNRALAEISAKPRPSLREKIAKLLGMAVERLRSVGALSGEGLDWAPAWSGTGKEKPSDWSRSVPSDDGRVTGTLFTEEGEVRVSFDTQDPALAGAQVAFALVDAADLHPFHEGRVTLEIAGAGIWEGREYLGRQRTLGIETDCELIFGIEELQK